MKMKQIPTLIELPDAPVGDKIRYYRLQRNMTQKELAEKCGLNESTIRNYELGNRTPKQEIIEDIAAALEVSQFAICDPSLSSLFGAIHILFSMEILHGMHPEMVDGEPVLKFPTIKGGSEKGSLFGMAVSAWAEKYKEWKDGEIDEETYRSWTEKYPEEVTREKKKKS